MKNITLLSRSNIGIIVLVLINPCTPEEKITQTDQGLRIDTVKKSNDG